jgi:mono/diheme cytochrome c family protein
LTDRCSPDAANEEKMKVRLAALFLLTLFPAFAAIAQEGLPPDQPGRGSLLGPTHFSESDGAQLYRALCQNCHMANGQGGSGAASYPALSGNVKLANEDYPVWMVLHGNKAMPALGGFLSDSQITAVVTYVRSHFGNGYGDPVTVEQVKALRLLKK